MQHRRDRNGWPLRSRSRAATLPAWGVGSGCKMPQAAPARLARATAAPGPHGG